jgi:hypothetical protein
LESAQRYLQRRGRDVVRIAELEGIRDWKIHAAPIEVEAVDLGRNRAGCAGY